MGSAVRYLQLLVLTISLSSALPGQSASQSLSSDAENRTLHDAHRRLGPVIRVAPNELSINDIGSLRTVYQGGFEKPEWYSVFNNYGYDERLDKTLVGYCSHFMSKAPLACSRPAPLQSTRRGSG